MAASGKKARTPLLAALGVLMLALGFGLGWWFSQRGPTKPGRLEKVEPSSKPAARVSPPVVKPSAPTSRLVPPPTAAPAPPPGGLPRFCLVIDDLGYASPELVARLCAQQVPFSVAVLPYQEFTRESARLAREAGKEVMLHLPMEPIGYPGPGKDPGPDAVMFKLTEREIRDRVKKALADVPRVKGVNNHMGSRITPDRTRMTWVLEEVRAARCFFVDSRTEKDSVAFEVAQQLGIPSIQRKVFLDDDKAFGEMEKQWNRALDLARKEGEVLIIGHIYPETVEALEKLIPRSRGEVRFVKASEVAR